MAASVRAPLRPPVVHAWKPRVASVREVFHARFTDHAYPPHVHEVWTLFIVDQGAIRYELHGRHHGADTAVVTLLPPHVVHDGRPAASGGYRKRVLYLEPEVFDDSLVGRAVDQPVIGGLQLRAQLSALHGLLACPEDTLEAETRLAFIVERIGAALGKPAAEPAPVPRADQAAALRAFLDARLFEPVTIKTAAAEIGVSPSQVVRSFSATFGIAPHTYVLGRRLEAARARILGGQDLADVAAAVGFCDQAHLTRRFRLFLGISPGRFRSRRGLGSRG